MGCYFPAYRTRLTENLASPSTGLLPPVARLISKLLVVALVWMTEEPWGESDRQTGESAPNADGRPCRGEALKNHYSAVRASPDTDDGR